MTSKADEILLNCLQRILSNWKALRIGVENRAGGVQSHEKAEWIPTGFLQWTVDNTGLERFEIEDFLVDILNSEFDLIVDDGSLPVIAQQIHSVYKIHQLGDLENLELACSDLPEVQSYSQLAVPGRALAEAEMSSDEESLSEKFTSQGEEAEGAAAASSSSSNKMETVVDEEGEVGFTLEYLCHHMGDSVLGKSAHLVKDLDREKGQLPFVYHPSYNITAWGLEKAHPFDTGKWGRIVGFLKEKRILASEAICIKPSEATTDDLLVVHTERYLTSLSWSAVLAGITEVPCVACVPNRFLQRKLLRSLRLQTGGTVLAFFLARKHGWAINIGGGFHHCSSDAGGGFCVYADIQLGIKLLIDFDPTIRKLLIVDLDAHQGNGHERDFIGDTRVIILDAFNPDIYPHDHQARRGIQYPIHLPFGVRDEKYTDLIRCGLNHALEVEKPDFVVYNAGTDIMAGDPLGGLSISPRGIALRDEIVFSAVRTLGIPIVMVTSGGYQRSTANAVADSIENLWHAGLLQIFDQPNSKYVKPKSVNFAKTVNQEAANDSSNTKPKYGVHSV